MTFGTFEFLLLVMGAVLLFLYPGLLRRLFETFIDSWKSLKTQFKKGRQESEPSEPDPPDNPEAGS